MNWKKFFLTMYKMIESKAIETPEMDDFVKSLSDNDNHVKIAFYLWRAYYNNQDKKMEFWGGLFREMLDFVSANEREPRNELIDKAQSIVDGYSSNDITKAFYHIIKEIERK